MDPQSLEYKELKSFNDWILAIGNGTIKHQSNINDDLDQDSIIVQVPEDLLIHTTGNKIEALVQFTYPDFKINFKQPEYLKERAILATTNEIVDEINDYILSLIPSAEKRIF